MVECCSAMPTAGPAERASARLAGRASATAATASTANSMRDPRRTRVLSAGAAPDLSPAMNPPYDAVGSVVVAADAGPHARDVRAVDVYRDRRCAGRVVDPVDVPGRRESADVSELVVASADGIEVGVEQLFVLD